MDQNIYGTLYTVGYLGLLVKIIEYLNYWSVLMQSQKVLKKNL